MIGYPLFDQFVFKAGVPHWVVEECWSVLLWRRAIDFQSQQFQMSFVCFIVLMQRPVSVVATARLRSMLASATAIAAVISTSFTYQHFQTGALACDHRSLSSAWWFRKFGISSDRLPDSSNWTGFLCSKLCALLLAAFSVLLVSRVEHLDMPHLYIPDCDVLQACETPLTTWAHTHFSHI